ncbi:MAG: tyrosine-type recombinase/integrase [Caulobacter sp.]|nr:tyrosine-type recombinase/integrase [Caulobacter sp.]
MHTTSANRKAQRLTKTLIENTPRDAICWEAETPGFGLRTTRGGAKSFIFQFRTVTGEQGRITLGRYPAMTVEEARRLAREHRVLVDKGGNPSRDRHEAREASDLRSLAHHYCEEYGPQRGLKFTTTRDARRILERYALPEFGRKKVKDFAPRDIRKMHAQARDGSGRYQANRLLAVLRKMFNLAKADQVVLTNPCTGIEKYQEDQRYVFLGEKEVGALLSACARYPDQNGANAVRMLLFTGARLREVLQADWDQIDLEAGVWVKPSAHTKQKRIHRLLLPPGLVETLRTMKERDPDTPFLFPGKSRIKPRVDLKSPWEGILKAAGIGHFRIHDLRRTTASYMLSSGSDLATVGKSLGHTQPSTTQRYAQLFEDVQRAGLSRAEEKMLQLSAS